MGALTLLPLDLSGKALTNRIAGEPQTLITVSSSTNRVVMLNHGGFFEDNLKVYDASGKSLTKGTDFVPVYLYDDLVELTGVGVYGFIVIKNAAVSATITVDYRAVGGIFGLSVPEVKAVMLAVADDNLTVKFSDIVGRPTAYIPKDHQHEWWQIIAMFTTVEELNRIRDSVGFGEDVLVDAATAYGQVLVAECQKVVTDFATAAQLHFSDFNNPHQTTKAQVQLGNLNNWAVATDAQSVVSSENALYLSPSGAYQILAAAFVPKLAAHLNDRNNPHKVTAAQLQAYTTAQINAQMATLLNRTAQAYNTNQLNGRTYTQFATDVRSNIPVGNVTSGQLPVARLGSGSGSWETLLMGNSNFRTIRNLFDTYEKVSSNAIWFGSFASADAGQATLNASYGDTNSFPIGTHAFATIKVAQDDAGERIVYRYETQYWTRTASGWAYAVEAGY